MIKHPMVRILSCGILASFLLGSHASAALQTPTVSAENNTTNEQTEIEPQLVEDIYTTIAKKKKKYKKGWVKDFNVNVREKPNKNSKILTQYTFNKKVKYIKYNKKWVKIKYKKGYAYIARKYISKKKLKPTDWKYSGPKLTRRKGIIDGPCGRETGYNLNMSGVVRMMKQLGYDYKYWVRNDGIKMYGDYVMMAADTKRYPKGTIMPTSLGIGMVCDHCVYAESYPGIFLDIATSW